MNIQTEIRERALHNFKQETDLTTKWREIVQEYDGDLTLVTKKEHLHFHVDVKKDLRLYQLDKLLEDARHHKPFMVIADTILGNVKEKLKEKGIAYIDGNGNAYINEGQVLIMIDGKKI